MIGYGGKSPTKPNSTPTHQLISFPPSINQLSSSLHEQQKARRVDGVKAFHEINSLRGRVAPPTNQQLNKLTSLLHSNQTNAATALFDGRRRKRIEEEKKKRKQQANFMNEIEGRLRCRANQLH